MNQAHFKIYFKYIKNHPSTVEINFQHINRISLFESFPTRSFSKATKEGANLKGFTNSTVNYKSESQDFRNINISLFVV